MPKDFVQSVLSIILTRPYSCLLDAKLKVCIEINAIILKYNSEENMDVVLTIVVRTF